VPSKPLKHKKERRVGERDGNGSGHSGKDGIAKAAGMRGAFEPGKTGGEGIIARRTSWK